MEWDDETITEKELREAFKLCGLWRNGWTFARAICTGNVLIGLQNTARAIRRRQHLDGQPAPVQRALI
jgi:hypothetical protein